MLVIRAHHMVNLGEGISQTEALLVKVDSRLCHCENQFCSQVFDQGLTHEDSLSRVHAIVILKHFEVAGTNCIQVC